MYEQNNLQQKLDHSYVYPVFGPEFPRSTISHG